jgi:hypothetical protein
VYASRPPSPTTTQHSLQGGTLLPYPGRTFTSWNAPALPGALITDFIGFWRTGVNGGIFAPGATDLELDGLCSIAGRPSRTDFPSYSPIRVS